MRVPKLTIGATLMLVVVVGACASNGDATLAPSAPPTPTLTPMPSSGPTSGPTSTPTPEPTLAPLPSAQPMSLLWEAHGPVTDNTSTTSIAIDPVDSNVWVGVPFENRFWILSPDGKYLESWGKSGKGPGEFDFSDHQPSPTGYAPIAFAPDGSFYVGDTGNDRVQEFDARRQFVREWGGFGAGDGQFNQIVSIATDGSTVYVGDGTRLDIQAFDTDGNYLRTMGDDGGFFFAALDLGGRVHATNPEGQTGAPQAMAIFDAAGAEVSRTDLGLASTDAVTNVAIDHAGNSYVPLQVDAFPWTPEGVVQLAPDGQIVRVLEGGGDFVGVSPAGDALYVANGFGLDTSQWTFVRKYALAGS